MDLIKYICHRKPKRTLKYRDHYFPVCARCTGFYLGIFISLIAIYPFLQVIEIKSLILYGLIFLIPMFLDGITQLLKLRERRL